MRDRQQGDRWRAPGRLGGLPPGVWPIPVGVVVSLLWFALGSPVVSAAVGADLSSEVVDRGTATIASCAPERWTFGTQRACAARITWSQHAETTDLAVRSRRDLAPGREVDVAAHPRPARGRSVDVTQFARRVVVVPTDDRAGSGSSVVVLTLANLGAMVVVWGAVAAAVARSRPEPELTVPTTFSDRSSGRPPTS